MALDLEESRNLIYVTFGAPTSAKMAKLPQTLGLLQTHLEEQSEPDNEV